MCNFLDRETVPNSFDIEKQSFYYTKLSSIRVIHLGSIVCANHMIAIIDVIAFHSHSGSNASHMSISFMLLST